MKYTVAIFAEGDFSDTESFEHYDLAQAFADGVHAGASLYGAGSVGVYILPDHEAQMRAQQSADEVERAMGLP